MVLAVVAVVSVECRRILRGRCVCELVGVGIGVDGRMARVRGCEVTDDGDQWVGDGSLRGCKMVVVVVAIVEGVEGWDQGEGCRVSMVEGGRVPLAGEGCHVSLVEGGRVPLAG